ncbi:hypothetical protein CUZ56_01856 [Saezia sanguinis]|uniref:Uncharacterized protein n=2 Tax=Saezia sanguinis TaxID=1965230 RepID=A0A433SD18_9BURK|nr:hypothetical protein CUZ56_01856 [Saezia sanguinis]
MRKNFLIVFFSCFFMHLASAQQSINFDYLNLGQTLAYPLCQKDIENSQPACIHTIGFAHAQKSIVGYGDRVGGIQGLKTFRLNVAADFDQALREQFQNKGITIKNGFSPWSINGVADKNNTILQYSFNYCASDLEKILQTMDQQFGPHQFNDLTAEAEKIISSERFAHPHGYGLYAQFYTWTVGDKVIVLTTNPERSCFELAVMTTDYFNQKSNELKYEPRVVHYL